MDNSLANTTNTQPSGANSQPGMATGQDPSLLAQQIVSDNYDNAYAMNEQMAQLRLQVLASHYNIHLE